MTTAEPGLLAALQGQLGHFYDVGVPHNVDDYLVTDRAMLAALTPGSTHRATDEQLILVEGNDGVDVALFLAPDVLARLAADDPRDGISGANLADFWTVLEGVSHFQYFAWNAGLDKPVTLLELEMQAEVDKYVSTRLLLRSRAASALGASLLQRLFAEPTLDPALDAEEVGRYRAASALAGRYCAGLESRFSAAGFDTDLVRELRSFYRLTQAAKIERIRGFA